MPNRPYQFEVEYVDGAFGTIPIWARDTRDALRMLVLLLPEHKEILRMTMFVRLEPRD